MPPQIHEVFEIQINSLGDFIQVAIIREGKIVIHYVVEYEAFIDGELRPVVRYDCSHDHPHRDTLGWDGRTVHKRCGPEGVTRSQALTAAIDDIRHNWERYRDSFLRRRP